MRHNFFYITFTIGTLLTSCSSYKIIPVSYMMPGKLHFPEDMRKVAVVANFPTTSTRPLEISRKNEYDSYLEQSTYKGTPRITCEALAQSLVNANYFDEVVICDSALAGIGLLSQEEVIRLTENLEVDFLLSLEDLDVHLEKQTAYVYPLGYISNISTKIKPQLYVYIPQKPHPILHIQPRDSMFQEYINESLPYAIEQLSENDIFINDASQLAGELLSQYISPHWINSERTFYKGGSVNLRDAAHYVKNKNDNKAILLWKSESEHGKSTENKLRARLNLALYYELTDQLEQALHWIKTARLLIQNDENNHESHLSTPSSYSQLIELYLQELEDREKSKEKLQIQMNRFQSNF